TFDLAPDLTFLLSLVVLWLGGAAVFVPPGESPAQFVAGAVLVAITPYVAGALGLLLLAVSMRRSNGYRGLHELASGTRVIRLPSPKRRFRLPKKAVEKQGTFPANRPRQIGIFAVRSLVRQGDGEALLLGEDVALQR